jgi:Uma2 family endonuclease
MTRSIAVEADTSFRLVLSLHSVGLTDDQYDRFCRDNPDLQIELTAGNELIIMSPTKPGTGRRNAKILQRLSNWAEQDGTGECFDSNSEFTLPNGAKRAPDASWISKSRWNRMTDEEKENTFTPICPDFVVELKSRSDRIRQVQKKMEEYIANGAKLGWLLDPIGNRAYIYRPGEPFEIIEKPEQISGDPVLPCFQFDFREIL